MSHPEDAAGDKYLFQDTMRDDASICVGSGSERGERGAGSGEREHFISKLLDLQLMLLERTSTRY